MIILSINITAEMKKLIEIQEERQKAMQELSQILGIDVSFSDEEMEQFAQEELAKYLDEAIKKKVDSWMK